MTLLEFLSGCVIVWANGMLVTLIIAILGFWFDDLPLSEIAFRIVVWPIFLVMLVVVGAKKSWQRYVQ